jgi:large subunit ribosomal protein L25
MIKLKAKKRETTGSKNNSLRNQGLLPAVLYGSETENIPLKIDKKEFEEAYQVAGESSLIDLVVDGKEFSVLVHQTARDPMTGDFIHVDFYQPSLKKKVEAEIPLVFENEAPAVKGLGGILEKEIQVLEVKGLAKDLPREIKVDLSGLETFEDRVLVKDLKIPQGIEIMKDENEIVAHVVPPKEEKVEEEVPKEEEGTAAEGEEKGEAPEVKETAQSEEKPKSE